MNKFATLMLMFVTVILLYFLLDTANNIDTKNRTVESTNIIQGKVIDKFVENTNIQPTYTIRVRLNTDDLRNFVVERDDYELYDINNNIPIKKTIYKSGRYEYDFTHVESEG